MSKKYRVFVYGTLKQGRGNHGLLKDSEFVGEHVTEPVFTMLHLGGFPGVIRGGDTAIHGELYDVDADTLQRLDWLEGVPSLYKREVLSKEDNILTYIYQNHGSTRGAMPSGVW